jgi:large subunit ribosomal protein L19
MNKKIKLVEEMYTKKENPKFVVGDTVRVLTKIPEGDKIRLHPFEGVVIARKDDGVKSVFTVRKVSFGEGTERVFPLFSPNIERIEIVRKGKVKRAKLYYLREKIGKRATKIEEDETEKLAELAKKQAEKTAEKK